MKLLITWRRLHDRFPLSSTVGLVASMAAPQVSAVLVLSRLNRLHPDAAWAFVAWCVSMLGLVSAGLVLAMLAQLIDADRAWRVRFKMTTGIDS